jgi:hypothetical protein
MTERADNIEMTDGPMLRRVVLAAHAAGIALGLGYGYSFGHRLSGPLLGVITAVIMAVFCSMMVSGAADLWLRLRHRYRDAAGNTRR